MEHPGSRAPRVGMAEGQWPRAQAEADTVPARKLAVRAVVDPRVALLVGGTGVGAAIALRVTDGIGRERGQLQGLGLLSVRLRSRACQTAKSQAEPRSRARRPGPHSDRPIHRSQWAVRAGAIPRRPNLLDPSAQAKRVRPVLPRPSGRCTDPCPLPPLAV